MISYKSAVEIRILPCSKKDKSFETVEQAKIFLLKTMKKRGGKYYFPKKPMNCVGDTLVLFQYSGSIIASAILTDVVEQKCSNESEQEYNGYLLFDMSTMKWLDEPITADEVRSVNSSFKHFSQAKQRIDICHMDSMIDLINKH